MAGARRKVDAIRLASRHVSTFGPRRTRVWTNESAGALALADGRGDPPGAKGAGGVPPGEVCFFQENG
jgi:hypothetical protein